MTTATLEVPSLVEATTVGPPVFVVLRDAVAAARAAKATGGIQMINEDTGKPGRRVRIEVWDRATRAAVEVSTVLYSLTDAAGEVVPTGWVMQAYKYAMDPNTTELSAVRSQAGGRRFAYNWLLGYVNGQIAMREQLRSMGEQCGLDFDDQATAELLWDTAPIDTSFIGLRNLWNAHKDRVAPWHAHNSKEAYAHAAKGLAAAFTAFYGSRNGTRKGKPAGWPQWARRSGDQSWAITTGMFGLTDKTHAKIPKVGSVKLHESAQKLWRRLQLDDPTARILSATITGRNDRWSISFQTAVRRTTGPEARPRHVRIQGDIVGVDWGVTHLATIATPDGRTLKIPNPKAYRTLEPRLAHLQQQLDATRQDSGRHHRLQGQINELHHRMANIRGEEVHRLTHWLATQFTAVVIEDLNIVGMTASPAPRPDPEHPGQFLPNGAAAKGGLAKSVLDACPGTIRRQLEYKTEWYGAILLIHPRFRKSTGVCECETTTTLELSQRSWTCTNCGTLNDRDGQAAITLAQWGLTQLPPHIVAGSGPETRNGRKPLTGPRQPRSLPKRAHPNEESMPGTAIAQALAA